MANRDWTVLIDWEDQGVCDADEIVVAANSESEAKRKARAEWRRTKAVGWPHIKIQKVCVLMAPVGVMPPKKACAPP
jgi:hypothetical protein